MSHSNQDAREQLQLDSNFSLVTYASGTVSKHLDCSRNSANPVQCVSEQPGYSAHTENNIQTVSVQPGYFSRTANASQTIFEQPGYSHNAANTVQTVSKLPGCSLHATECEQFYHEIADQGFTSASPVTNELTIRLPRLAYTHGP